MEQNVDIPVPHGRRNRGGGGVFKVYAQDRIQQRLAEQCTLTFQFLMVVVVGEVLKIYALDRPFCGADLVDIPVPRGGGPHGPVSTASSSQSPNGVDETSTVFFFFRTVPQTQKSAPLGPHSGSELGADFNPWTPAAMALESETGSESESESEVEEGAATRFEAGFRPLRVCTRFLELHMGRPVRGCANYGHRCAFAHSFHPEASAHEHELASYLPE